MTLDSLINPTGKKLTFFKMLNIICLTLIISIGIYYGFLEKPFLTYSNLPFPVLNSKLEIVSIPKIEVGNALLILVDRCNTDNKTRIYTVSHRLVSDKLVILLEATTTSIEPGCFPIVSAVNVIPKNTPPGIYHLEGYSEVQGTLRTSSISWRSQDFEVIKNKD